MPLNWSSKKQISFFLAFFVVFTIGIFILILPYINKPPTCFDGKQNGDESGVDCGGSCARVCLNQTYGLVTKWSRAFNVNGSIYNLVAMVENQNIEVGVPSISYEFRVYDDKNIFIGRRQGTTFISSNDRTIIFEGVFDVGNRVVGRTDFTFTSKPNWIRINRNQRNSLAIDVQDRVIRELNDITRIEASVINNTLLSIKNLDVYIIIYDKDGNVINSSKTFIPLLNKNSKSPIYFTWPKKLEENPSIIEILPQVNIFELI